MAEGNFDNEIFPEIEKIAIDGPVASGKGTVARLISERLGILNVDTGAMYRTVALISICHNIDPADEEELAIAISKSTLHQRPATEEERFDGRAITVFLGDQDITWEIRTPEASRRSSIVAQHPKVRAALICQQQLMAQTQSVVMEGRDITHTVLPDANIKIYLDATPEVRAQRRYQELIAKGKEVTFEEVLRDLMIRDETDRRKNLRVEPDAWYIDCSNLTSYQVACMVINKLFEKRERKFLEAEASDMNY